MIGTVSPGADAGFLADAGILVDAGLFASATMALFLAATLALATRTSMSSHLRHTVLLKALLVGPVLFAGFLVARPGPVGCVSMSCPSVDASSAARARQHYALEAAGKFRRSSPPAAASIPLAASGPAPTLAIVWAVGSVLLLGRVARRRLRLRRLLRDADAIRSTGILTEARRISEEMGVNSPPRLLRHPRVAQPVVGGTVRPAVFLPPRFERMPQAERRMVLLHELGHVRRRDPGTTLLVDVITSVFWFHPLVWIAGARVARLQEMATDSRVVEAGVLPSDYAGYLLSTWRKSSGRTPASGTPLHSIAGDSMITDRVHSLLDPRSRHGTPRRWLGAAISAGFAALLGGAFWSPAMLGSSAPQERTPTAIEARLLTPTALDSLLRPVFINRMTDRYVAGAAISIVHEGRVVYAAGFGDREVYSEDPVDPARTIFRIGSVTKVLTGVAVMQLVDRGLVDLDADVNDYLSEVRVPEAFSEPVRVRHLLTHTAGFDQIGLDRHAASAESVEALAKWLPGRLARIRPPGEVSAYDTYAITLAGHLVEAVSGLPYENYLDRHVFAPLRMGRTGITVGPALADDVAVGYGFAGEWEAMPWEHMNTSPASSVNATVLDMAKLAVMFLAEGRVGSRRVLAESSTRAMLTRQFTNHPDHPGYGFTFFEGDWNGIETFGHGGSMAGYSAMLTLVPEHELGIFIAYNQESGALIDPVLDALFGALFPSARPEPLRERFSGYVELARFDGTYASNVYHHGNPDAGWRRQPVAVTRGTGETSGAIVFEGAAAWPVGPLTFQREDGLLISFLEDEDGTLTHMVIGQAVYEKLD